MSAPSTAGQRIREAMRGFDGGDTSGVDAVAELTRAWDQIRREGHRLTVGIGREFLAAAERACEASPEAHAAAGALRQSIDADLQQSSQPSFREDLARMLSTQLYYRPDDRYDLIRAAEANPIGMPLEHRLELLNLIRRIRSHRALTAALHQTSPTAGGIAAPGIAPEIATRSALWAVVEWCLEGGAGGRDAKYLLLDLVTEPRIAPLAADYVVAANLHQDMWPYRLQDAMCLLELNTRDSALTRYQRERATRARHYLDTIQSGSI